MVTESVILVIDASESAASLWETSTKVISELIAETRKDSVKAIHLLGTDLSWSVERWEAKMPIPKQAKGSGSFIAPVMKTLRVGHFNQQAITIVGAGQIFDLPDWLNDAALWALVNTGGDSLQEDGLQLMEVEANGLKELLDNLSNASTHLKRRAIQMSSGFVKQQWGIDRTGYPMIFVPRLNAFVHLFPLVKPQFEEFLAESRLPNRGDSYYAELLNLNPRLSPFAASCEDYERFFITGLISNDIREYIRWHGGGLRVMTVEEWRAAFRWLQVQEISVIPAELESQLAPTARALLYGLRNELQPHTLLDLALMRNGIIEWVIQSDQKWVGLGSPRNEFFPNLFDPLGTVFKPPFSDHRSKVWGVRLMQPRT